MITRPASLLWFLLLVGGGRMLAQTVVYWDYPYIDVLKTLYKIENLEILFEEKDFRIVVQQGNFFATYSFEKGTLYQIECTQTYDRARKARKAYEDCMDYFLYRGAIPGDCCEDANKKQVIAIRNGKVFRLSMIRQTSGAISVTMLTKDVSVAPLCTLKRLDWMALNSKPDEE